ncbi:hypothetical protein CDAR_243411 [Caerostris darwini]|uniref:Uncharacterized protein n=1 Tax=Caerostris darwini TaxID=1538125 RepID=A0AAV4UTB5_9ARAC|nr:hypothetical protein CDAR_243411 [Caerostris darwini]
MMPYLQTYLAVKSATGHSLVDRIITPSTRGRQLLPRGHLASVRREKDDRAEGDYLLPARSRLAVLKSGSAFQQVLEELPGLYPLIY